ncbi:hypothetical protein P5673_030319 [Acropora cervicornis]|uniref:Uncharacterized protein n=1 Tax=Acropora cervicornis TaxID=6130 RepID=A0AAD9PUI3_ACRCE|nr:hypothetical protein P5673_030319 [Acropora cervicornis]
MFGFTQPFTALPVIEDVSNNAKGFTSRILWFFPEPVFCKMKQNILDEEECQIVDIFKSQLVDFLADLYIHGESTYIIEDENKLKTVSVNRTQYHLSQEALMEFEQVHDNWELHICQKNPRCSCWW